MTAKMGSTRVRSVVQLGCKVTLQSGKVDEAVVYVGVKWLSICIAWCKVASSFAHELVLQECRGQCR